MTNNIDDATTYSIQIPNIRLLANLMLSELIINGVSINLPEPDAQWYDLPTIDGINATKTYRIRNSDNGLSLQFRSITPTKDVNIAYAFEESIGVSTPSVSVYEDDTEKGTVSSPELIDSSNSIWKITATPAGGYQLAYIQIGEDTTTRIPSEDGTTITWEVSSDAEYTAYFEDATLHYDEGSLRYAPFFANSGVMAAFPQASISAGQRVGFYFTYSLPSRSSANSTFRFELFAGQDTSGASLAAYSRTYESTVNAGKGKQMCLTVDPLPSGLSKVTIAMQINDGAIITKTFDVTVSASGSTELDFFSVPEEGIYPSDNRTLQPGPNVYDAAAFVDANSGKLSMYFAVTGGVMKYDAKADTKLVPMAGMSFGYNDNESSSGYAFAVGGADQEHLAALVKATSGDFYNGITTTYCIYECVNDVWSMVEGSELSTAYSAGLVMSRDDIWVSDRHWDGSAWTASGYSFNSFWKESNSSAYAGSANGLYHYDGAAWTQVSGVSGAFSISGAARNADGSVTLISTEATRADVRNNSAVLTTVSGTENIIAGYVYDNTVYVGIDEAGELYGIAKGRLYADVGTAGYYGSFLYKQESGGWVYQIVDAFNDPNEDDSMLDSKIRPDGVRYILNPCEGVSLFLGQAGAIYGEFGDSTITFETNGGTSVAPITRAINSAVTAPVSPTRDGYTFVGWFTLDSFLQNGASFAWGLMPAKDITLYAKWVENGSGGDVFATERSNAENSLNTAYQRLTESEYSAEIWAQIVAAYETGLSGIRAAATYDGIYAALNTAIDEINALSQYTNQTITVAVTVEKLTVDGKYIIEPTLVEVKKYTQASVVLTDLLKEKYADTYEGTPYRITGTVSNSFYLAGIYDPAYVPATSGNNGKNAEGEDFDQTYEDFLSEFDGGRWAGWMYCVNGKFPGVGASGWTLLDGEVMRWQYSCTGLGCDIGADNSEWGATNSTEVADKDALIWKVAEINRDGKQSDFGEAYTNAMTVLKTIEASQDAVNAALAALNNGSGSEPSVTAENGEGGGSVTVGSKTLSVVSNGAAVTAAVGEGDIVTITVQTYKTSDNEQVASAAITLTGTAAYADGSNVFTVTSTGDVPCVIFVKNGENYEKRSVNTAGGVHSVTLAADEEIVVAVKGDATGDGQLNAADWSAIIARFKSGSFAGLPAWAPLLYDVNEDGAVNAGDWSAMIAAFKGVTALVW